MTYRRPMRYTATIGHAMLASIPVLAMVGLLFVLMDTEKNILWQMRLHKDAYPLFKHVMDFITDWGNPALYIAYLALLMRGVRGDAPAKRYFWAYIFFQVTICFLVVNGVKIAIGRPRPEAMDAFFKSYTLDPLFTSLPSGHTAEITGSCIALALWVRRKSTSLLLGLVIALMGFTRIYLNKHYPSDVFFGWMLGLLAASGIYAFGTKDTPDNG